MWEDWECEDGNVSNKSRGEVQFINYEKEESDIQTIPEDKKTPDLRMGVKQLAVIQHLCSPVAFADPLLGADSVVVRRGLACGRFLTSADSLNLDVGLPCG